MAASPGAVVVRPSLVGLDWFDALGASRMDFDRPFIPGREFVGIVKETAKQDSALLGQRVVAFPDVVCGQCEMCRSGLSTHCRQRRLLGAPGCDGCLGERFTVPSTNLCPISQSLDDDSAVFALPVARSLHAASIVHLEGRPYITVLGKGVEALIAAQVMTKLNASVRIVSTEDATLSAADRLGVRHRPLCDVGQRGDQDVIVDVSEPGSGFEIAATMTRPRGKIVLLRPLTPPDWGQADAVDITPIVEREIEVIGCRGARMREAIMMLERGEVAVEGLITQRFQLLRAKAAIKAAADASQLKVVVEI
jgi:threonine dehydrogenase-like Zn-dependent dehydrogenase